MADVATSSILISLGTGAVGGVIGAALNLPITVFLEKFKSRQAVNAELLKKRVTALVETFSGLASFQSLLEDHRRRGEIIRSTPREQWDPELQDWLDDSNTWEREENETANHVDAQIAANRFLLTAGFHGLAMQLSKELRELGYPGEDRNSRMERIGRVWSEVERHMPQFAKPKTIG